MNLCSESAPVLVTGLHASAATQTLFSLCLQIASTSHPTSFITPKTSASLLMHAQSQATAPVTALNAMTIHYITPTIAGLIGFLAGLQCLTVLPAVHEAPCI